MRQIFRKIGALLLSALLAASSYPRVALAAPFCDSLDFSYIPAESRINAQVLSCDSATTELSLSFGISSIPAGETIIYRDDIQELTLTSGSPELPLTLASNSEVEFTNTDGEPEIVDILNPGDYITPITDGYLAGAPIGVGLPQASPDWLEILGFGDNNNFTDMVVLRGDESGLPLYAQAIGSFGDLQDYVVVDRSINNQSQIFGTSSGDLNIVAGDSGYMVAYNPNANTITTVQLDYNGTFWSVDSTNTSPFVATSFNLVGIADMDNDGVRDEPIGVDGGNLVILPADLGDPNAEPLAIQPLPTLSAAAQTVVNSMASPELVVVAGGDIDNDNNADDIVLAYIDKTNDDVYLVGQSYDPTGVDHQVQEVQQYSGNLFSLGDSTFTRQSLRMNKLGNILMSIDQPTTTDGSTGSGGSTASADIDNMTMTIDADWPGGITGYVNFDYTGATTLPDWTIEFNSKFDAYEFWDSTLVSKTAEADGTFTYVLDNGQFNGTVNPGDTVSLGFNSNDIALNLLDPVQLPISNESMTVLADWGTGFSSQASVQYDGTKPLRDWTLELDSAGNQAYEAWDSVLIGQAGDTVELEDIGYNAVVASGGTVTVGVNYNGQGARTASNHVLYGIVDDPAASQPSNYVFNGVAAGGGGSASGGLPTVIEAGYKQFLLNVYLDSPSSISADVRVMPKNS